VKKLATQYQKVLFIIIPATLFMAAISAYSSIVSHQAVFNGCKQRELSSVATLLQNDLQSQMNRAAASASMIVNLPSVKEAFRANNHEKLLGMLQPSFLIQRDRYGVLEGQFHTAPATSFLRILAPGDGRGKDVSSFREMVVNTNKEHEPRKGIEIGQRGLSIRGIDLVKDADGYIGSFEVGTSFMTVLESVKKNTRFEVGAFVNNDMISRIATSLPPPDAERIIAGFRNIEATDWNILKPIVTPDLLTSDIEVKMMLKTINGKDYGIVTMPLQDYKGDNIGVIIAAQNFDTYHNQMAAAVIRAIAFALLQVLVIAGVVIVTISVMFVRPAEKMAELPK
jgi:hypothetical protein